MEQFPKFDFKNGVVLLFLLIVILFSAFIVTKDIPASNHPEQQDSGATVVGLLGSAPTSKVIASVPTPVALAYTASRGRVMVASSSMDSIFVLKSATYQVIANVTLGGSPVAVTYSNVANDFVYAASGTDTISAIDGDQLAIVASANVSSPSAMAYDAIHNLIYVASNASNSISAINASTAEILQTVSICCKQSSVA